MYRRNYVQVTVTYDEDGRATPVSIRYAGRDLPVDRLLERRPAPATKAGGQGMRYTVRIGTHQTYLFQEDDHRWFVEEKDPLRSGRSSTPLNCNKRDF